MKSRDAATRQTRSATSSVFYNEKVEDKYLANYSIGNFTPEFIAENKPSDWDINAPYMKIGNIGQSPVPFVLTALEREITSDKNIKVSLKADSPPSKFSDMQLYDNDGNALEDSYYKLSPTNAVWKKSTEVEFDLSKDGVKGLFDPMNMKDDVGVNMYNGLYDKEDATECSNKDELYAFDTEYISEIDEGEHGNTIRVLSDFCTQLTEPFTDGTVIELVKDIHDAYSNVMDDTGDIETLPEADKYDAYATKVQTYKKCIDSNSSESAISELNKSILDYNTGLDTIWYLFDLSADSGDRKTLTIDAGNYIEPLKKKDEDGYIKYEFTGKLDGNDFTEVFDAPPQLLKDEDEAFSSLDEFRAAYGITELGFLEESMKLDTWLETQKPQNTYKANNIKYIAELLWQMYAKRRAIASAKPATRTMYIDSNIALTSGTACINGKDNAPKIIPNLFNAIETLQEKTNRISKWAESHKHGPIPTTGTGELSTADKLLYVENYTEGDMARTTIVPQKTGTSSGVTTGGSVSDALRLRAGNIEFEIESANTTLSGYLVKYEKPKDENAPESNLFNADMNYIFVPVEDSDVRLADNAIHLADGIHGRIMYADGEIYRVLKSHIVTDSSKYLFKPQKKDDEAGYKDLELSNGAEFVNIDSTGRVPVIFSLPYNSLFADESANDELFPYKFATYVDAVGDDAVVKIYKTTNGGVLYADWASMEADVVITQEVPLYLVKPGNSSEILDNEADIENFIDLQVDNKDDLVKLFGIPSEGTGESTDITGYNVNAYTATTEAYVLCPAQNVEPGETIPWASSDSKYSFELVECRNIYDDVSMSLIDFQTKKTTVYNLQAIVEAIQELNRRTLFMDTDISFSDAMTFNDVAETDIPYVSQEKTEDGLPAAGMSPIH